MLKYSFSSRTKYIQNQPCDRPHIRTSHGRPLLHVVSSSARARANIQPCQSRRVINSAFSPSPSSVLLRSTAQGIASYITYGPKRTCFRNSMERETMCLLACVYTCMLHTLCYMAYTYLMRTHFCVIVVRTRRPCMRDVVARCCVCVDGVLGCAHRSSTGPQRHHATAAIIIVIIIVAARARARIQTRFIIYNILNHVMPVRAL